MPTDFDTLTLIVYGSAALAGAYFLAAATDSVIGRDGFGTIANMIILIAGASVALFAVRLLHLPVYNSALLILIGVAGAYGSLALLAVMRAFGRRLHY